MWYQSYSAFLFVRLDWCCQLTVVKKTLVEYEKCINDKSLSPQRDTQNGHLKIRRWRENIRYPNGDRAIDPTRDSAETQPTR